MDGSSIRGSALPSAGSFGLLIRFVIQDWMERTRILVRGGSILLLAVTAGVAGDALRVENGILAVEILPETGAVAGMWDLRLDKRVVQASNDRYGVETREGRTEADETSDHVVSVEQKEKESITLRCENAKLPDLLITKTYRFTDSAEEIAKTVTFASRTDGGYFVDYATALSLDPAFVKGGRFDLHAADYLGPGERALDHRGDNRVVVQYRYRVNDRYVTPVTGFPYSDADRYTDSGWFDPVFMDYLGPGDRPSAEVRTLVMAGDEFDYYTYYDHLPEVEAVYDIEVSDWFWKACRMDAMYFTRNSHRDFGAMPAMTTRWNLNVLWGDYFSEGDLVIGSTDVPRPTIPAAEVAAEHKAFLEEAPHWRLSMYSWLWTIAASSRTYAEHPEFVITTKDGTPDRSTWKHDVTGDTSYLKQLRAPGMAEYFLDQYRRYAETMGIQFIYIDGCPIGISRPDWKLNTVQQVYDWLDYFRRVRDTIRSVHPDGFLFVNNPNQAYADGGYYEDHNMRKNIEKDWRAYAHKLMVLKFRERPKRWHALLYWMEANKPLYSNYTLGLGFTYSSGGTEWHPIKMRVYVDAAWELRGSRMVMAVKSPRYWREPTEFEVYSLRKGEEAIVSVVNHGEETATVPVRLDAAALGLDPDKPVYIWWQRMRDNRDAKEWEDVASQCFEKIYLGEKRVENGELKIDVEARPILLEQLILTQRPAWFTHLDGETLRTVQNNLLTASIRSDPEDPHVLQVEIEKGPATVFFLAPDEERPLVTLNGDPATVEPATLGNVDGFSTVVPGGRHTFAFSR